MFKMINMEVLLIVEDGGQNRGTQTCPSLFHKGQE